MINIPLTTFTIEGLNTLRVEVGSNYPCGGDAGHGGRTVLRLVDKGNTDMRIRVDGGALMAANSIELVFGGDAEHESLVEALEFAVQALKVHPATSRGMAQVE
jgi:hypothetical protein